MIHTPTRIGDNEMATEPVKIVRYTRTRAYDVAIMIGPDYAMRICERHFARNDFNYVEVNGRLCWTLYQAECQIRKHFH